MGMKIDESGGDHLTFDVDNGASVEPGCGHGCDPAAANPDISDGIEIGFRIYDAAVGQHDVIGLRQQWGNQGE